MLTKKIDWNEIVFCINSMIVRNSIFSSSILSDFYIPNRVLVKFRISANVCFYKFVTILCIYFLTIQKI